jgi:hypothetical protein
MPTNPRSFACFSSSKKKFCKVFRNHAQVTSIDALTSRVHNALTSLHVLKGTVEAQQNFPRRLI